MRGHSESRQYDTGFIGRISQFTADITRSAVSLLVTAFLGEQPASPPERSNVSGRFTDRDKHPRSPEERKSHVFWGSALVLFVFLVSFAGGGGFIYAYWYEPDNHMLIGGTLAVFFFFLGVAFVLYAHWLMSHKQAIEPRERLSSPFDEREAAAETFHAAEHEVHRRGMLKWMVAAAAGIFAAIFISLLKSLETPPSNTLFAPVWKSGQRLVTIDGTPLSVDSLTPNSMAVVFPEDQVGAERAQTVLIRLDEKVARPLKRTGWSTHGYVAYSRVCTHAGCPVGMYETTTCQLLCPCHQSTFDVLRAAEPTGGPAARALPQLPIYAGSDGFLRAGGDFSEPPGPGFWWEYSS